MTVQGNKSQAGFQGYKVEGLKSMQVIVVGGISQNAYVPSMVLKTVVGWQLKKTKAKTKTKTQKHYLCNQKWITPYDPAILLSIYPRELKTYVHRETYR